MKLFIKRDKTVDGAMFAVLDERCENKYYVKSDKKSIVLCDLQGKKLLKIKRIVLPAVKSYSLLTKESTIRFVIRRNNSTKKYYCNFYGKPWSIRGDFFEKSFDIIGVDNSVIATHSRRFSDSGGGYELNINSEHNELFCVGIAVCANLEAKVDKFVVQPV